MGSGRVEGGGRCSGLIFSDKASLSFGCATFNSDQHLNSPECCKTKTKVIILTNYKGHRQSSEPIKTERKCM